MNDPTRNVHLGVDVCKKQLDLSPFPGLRRQYPNTPQGVTQLLDDLGPEPPVVCCEATGGYEGCLVEHCLERGVPVAKLNPARVRHFAKAIGILAKTDRIDAAVIAEFARSQPPRQLQRHPAWNKELAALVARRNQLVDMRKQEANRLDPAPPEAIAAAIRDHMEHLAALISEMDKALAKLVEATQEVAEFSKRVCQVKGIGLQTALSVLATMPELGTLTGREATSLAGLAPFVRESGDFKGKSFIGGGRSAVRRALYMPAVVAVRYNPILREFYQRKKREGKPSKVALTAVMRKMLVLMNKIAADPDFVPDAAGCAS